MAKGFKAGAGGGDSSKLIIVGGANRPANVSQNTIWIDTDVEITSYVLSATEPENPVDGMVWIIIGNSGVTKLTSPVGKEWVTIYPLSANQYVGGAWADVEAKSYQFGAWVNWHTYLYEVGNVFKELTGGYTSFLDQGGGYARVDADGMHFQTIKTGSYYYPSSGLSTGNKIDFTKHKTITVKGTLTRNGTGSSFWVGLFPNSGNNMGSPVARSYYENNGDFVFYVDIQNVAGSYYLKVGTMVNQDQGGGTPEATVTKIWMW